MYVIGITGGVGSGKTVVTRQLAEISKGDMLIADELGHRIMERGSIGYCLIVDTFGTEILDEEKNIARERLAEVVFSDDKKYKKLNAIIHPEVMKYLKKYIDERKEQKGYIILENAIMFETGCNTFCNEIWYVAVSDTIREQRLMKNRGYSKEKIDAIMKKQLAKEEYMEKCQKCIYNNGYIVNLKNDVREAFENIVL